MRFSSRVALSCAMALVVATAVTATTQTYAPGTPGVTKGQPFCCVPRVCDSYGRNCVAGTECSTYLSGWTGSGAKPDWIPGGDMAQCTPAKKRDATVGSYCNPDTKKCEPLEEKPFCCQLTSYARMVSYQTCDAAYGGTAYMKGTTPTGPDVKKCTAKYGTPIVDATCKTPYGSSHPVCVPDYVSGGEGDPHIHMLDGRSYLLWGKDATTYNLLSERSHSVNIRLYTPATMKEGHALYIDAVGVLIRSAKIAVRLVNPAEHVKGAPAPAPASLELSINEGPGLTYPGHPVDRAIDAYTSYSMRNPNKITITSRDLVLSVVLMENFYLDVLVDEVAAHWSNVHGILGQSHASAFKLRYNYARGTAVGELPNDVIAKGKGQKYNIKGKEEDYITSGLLKTDDKFTRFEPTAEEAQSKTRKLAGADEAVAVASTAGVRERTHAGAF